MNKISIIIITYNRAEDCLELLQSIQTLNYQYLLEEVIIVNNASTTDYRSVTSFISSVKHIPYRYVNAPANLGVAGGRNYAANLATGDIWMFVDDDILFTNTNALQQINTAFDIRLSPERPPGAISFKVYYFSTREMQVTAFPHKQFERYKDVDHLLTYYYVGCAHAIPRTVWQQAGNYPEDFFYGMEEYDLSYRILNAGYAIQYDASVVLLHKESPLGRTPHSEKLRMMWVNKSKVAWRYLPRIYFFTTTLMWSVEYLRKAGFQWNNYLKGWKQVAAIPFKEKRQPVSQNTLSYLKKVDARLRY